LSVSESNQIAHESADHSRARCLCQNQIESRTNPRTIRALVVCVRIKSNRARIRGPFARSLFVSESNRIAHQFAHFLRRLNRNRVAAFESKPIPGALGRLGAWIGDLTTKRKENESPSNKKRGLFQRNENVFEILFFFFLGSNFTMRYNNSQKHTGSEFGKQSEHLFCSSNFFLSSFFVCVSFWEQVFNLYRALRLSARAPEPHRYISFPPPSHAQSTLTVV